MGDQGVCKGCQFEDEDKNRPECLNCRRRLGLGDETVPEVKKTSETKPDQKNPNEKIENPVNGKKGGRGPSWTDEDVRFLHENVKKMKVKDIAEHLGRTANATRFRLSVEGLTRRKKKDPKQVTPESELCDAVNRFRSLFFVEDSYDSTAIVIPAVRAVGRIKPGAVLRGEPKEFVFEIPVADYRRITCRYRDMETATKMRTALLAAIENYYQPGG